MKLETFLDRVRWVALLLPLFALFSALHVGCIGGSPDATDTTEDEINGGYGYGYGYGYGE